MPPELQTIETELKGAVEALRAAVTETKERDGMQTAKIEQINAEVERLSQAQTEILRRMRAPNRAGVEERPEHERAAEGLRLYVRRGDAALTAEHRQAHDLLRKELSVDSDPDGGYLVTPAISARIIGKVRELNPIRQLATVETISTGALEGLVDQDDAGYGWVSERQARPNTKTPQLGTWRIPVHEVYANPKATQTLLDDAAMNVEEWLARKVAEGFALGESEAFLTGDGVAKPRGLLTYPAGTGRGKIEQVPSGAAAAIAPASIINIVYTLKGAYLSGAAWLMNRATQAAIRTIRDASGATADTGQFMWQPGFGGAPSTLAGYPIYDAPGFDNVGAGKVVAAFGNIRQAYTVVDRQGIRVLRDPYSSKPYVELYTTRRVGGDVLDFDAVKFLKIAAN